VLAEGARTGLTNTTRSGLNVVVVVMVVAAVYLGSYSGSLGVTGCHWVSPNIAHSPKLHDLNAFIYGQCAPKSSGTKRTDTILVESHLDDILRAL